MNKALFPILATMVLAMFLSTACAEQGQDNAATAKAGESAAPAGTSGAAEETVSVLDQPVDFSSPEAIEKTMQNIREQEGEAAEQKLNDALDAILYYDLSLGNDREKMYKKMDGQTPNQIFARMKKR